MSLAGRNKKWPRLMLAKQVSTRGLWELLPIGTCTYLVNSVILMFAVSLCVVLRERPLTVNLPRTVFQCLCRT